MTVLIDTNVILDVLLRREQFLEKSSLVMLLSEKNIIDGYVTASAITDIFFITNATYKNKQKSMGLLKDLLKTINIATVTGEEIYRAINLNWNDFEDAVQYSAGERIQADYIVTRDVRGYANNTIPALQPADFLTIIDERSGVADVLAQT
ncbi:MAG: PIN domain-containing protein [Treponema sp.]|jgi:predicted nucleic acid-binding protein|nr:PIN domain-containing protein [Treponema sp.]